MQLKARDSPEGEDSGDGRTHLIFILCVSVVWTVSGEEGAVGWGGGMAGKTTRANTNTDAHAPSAEAGVVIPSDTGKVGKSRRVWLHLHSWQLLTCDLPNGAEHVEFLRIQRFNIVIDVPASEKRTS